MSGARAHAAAGLLLLGLTAIVHAPLAAPGRAPYSPYSDVLAEHVALKQVAYEHGPFVLWRTDQMLGAPALTNPQALFLHPLHAAFWFLPPAAAVGITFLIQLWVAGWGCYMLARALGVGWLAAMFSGAAGLSAFKLVLAVHAGWLAPLATLAMVPWLLAGLLRVAETPDRSRALQLAWIGALAFAGGSPQVLYYACILALGCVASRGLKPLAIAAFALAAAGACNAYLWVPVGSDWPWLSRASGTLDYAYFLSGHGLDFDALRSLVLPSAGAREPWESQAYFGWLPLALAVFAAARAPARSLQRAAAVAFVVSLGLSLDTPLLRAVHAVVPGYAAFRLPGRMLFLTTFLGIALAGAGLERLIGGRKLERGLALAAIVLVALEGGVRSAAVLETVPVAELLPDAAHPLRAPEFRTRVAVIGRRTLNYGWSAALGLHMINGYDPYNYAHVKRLLALIGGQPAGMPGNWFDLKRIARPELLDALAVRYVVASAPIELPQLRLVLQREDVRNFAMYRGFVRQPLYVYENTSALPYARFAASGGEGARVEVERAEPGRLSLRARAAKRQTLVVAETFHPGWRARVDGRNVAPVMVNTALLGFDIDAGAHRVELAFVPLNFEVGLGVSVLALAVLAAVSVRLSARSRARTTPPPHRDA